METSTCSNALWISPDVFLFHDEWFEWFLRAAGMPRRRLCTIGIVGIWLSLSLGLARAALLSLGAESGWTGRTKQLQSLGKPRSEISTHNFWACSSLKTAWHVTEALRLPKSLEKPHTGKQWTCILHLDKWIHAFQTFWLFKTPKGVQTSDGLLLEVVLQC